MGRGRASFEGHISRADLQLGQIVHEGQVLVELDSTTPRNALEEGTTHLAALRRDVAALNRQVQAEMRAFEADRARQVVAIQETGAAADEATAYLEAARRQSDDLAKLRTTRDLLLPRLLSGQLNLLKAEDAPAAVEDPRAAHA